MTCFFTADPHLGHKNIIRFQNRPFADVHEMNVGIVGRWNERVTPKDTIYVLGDMLWGSPRRMLDILDKLHGTIHLIEGCHDQTATHKLCRDRFESITPLKRITHPDPDAHEGKRTLILCHYAMDTWYKSHWGSWHLFAHSHGMRPDRPDQLAFDVGVDCHDYYPLSYEEVKAIMAKKTWTPPFKSRR